MYGEEEKYKLNSAIADIAEFIMKKTMLLNTDQLRLTYNSYISAKLSNTSLSINLLANIFIYRK